MSPLIMGRLSRLLYATGGPSITEDFTGLAGTLIGKTTTTGGKVWTHSLIGVGDWNLDGSGHGTPGAGGVIGAHIDAGLSDATFALTLVTLDLNSAHGFLLRYTDAANWAAAFVNEFSNRAIIQKTTTAGGTATLDSQVITPVAGDAWTCVLSGTSITLKQNGTTRATTAALNDAVFTGVTKHGLYTNSNAASAGTVDNYSVT